MAHKKRRAPITKAALKAKLARARQAKARKAYAALADRVAEARYAEQVKQLRVTREQVREWVREEMQHLAFVDRAKVERWAAFTKANADTKAGQLIEGQKFTPRGDAIASQPNDASAWEKICGQT